MTQAQRYDASRHFVAKPDGNGGVRLSLRTRFRDQSEFLPGSKSRLGTGVNEPPVERVGKHEVQDDDEMIGSYLGDDGIARSGPIGDQDMGEKLEQTICVFTPAPGASYHFEELDNGTIRVVLVSDPAELIGDTVTSNMGTISTDLNDGPSAARAMDRAARFVAKGRANEPAKLRTINSINARFYGR